MVQELLKYTITAKNDRNARNTRNDENCQESQKPWKITETLKTATQKDTTRKNETMKDATHRSAKHILRSLPTSAGQYSLLYFGAGCIPGLFCKKVSTGDKTVCLFVVPFVQLFCLCLFAILWGQLRCCTFLQKGLNR